MRTNCLITHRMKSLLTLFVIALSSFSVVACGRSSKDTSLASGVSPGVTTPGNVQPARTSASTTSTARSSLSHKGMDAVGYNIYLKTQRYLRFGHKADQADTRAVAVTVKRYYGAVATDDGARACSLIYSPMAKALPEVAGEALNQPTLRYKSCALAMSLLVRHRNEQPTADVKTIEVTSVRVKGAQGIALLRSRRMRAGEIVVHREGPEWKIQDTFGSVLPVPRLVPQT